MRSKEKRRKKRQNNFVFPFREKGEKMKKYVAEFIGTMCLVTLGCGTAMLVGCSSASGSGYLLTALAFGLVIVGMAYCIGNISGCHINPAVSLGVLISGRMDTKDFCGYVVAQCLGALAGAGILAAIFSAGNVTDMTASADLAKGAFGLGCNGLGGVGDSALAGLLVECLLTFFFVLTIIGVTDPDAGHGSFGGLIIGLTLVLIHIFGIGLTGTSVNPARSLGPAIVAAISGNTNAIGVLWVFIAGPFAGAALAAVVYKFLKPAKK